MLKVTDYDGPGDVPLLIAHGLFGSARNWGSTARRLSQTRPVRVVDMRNHGESFWSDDHSYAAMAGDLAGILDGPSDVLGHSMGGKAAMVLALSHPELVRKLVVADISPVAYGHSQGHLVEAMKALPLEQIGSRADADRLLAERVEDRGVRAFLLQSLDRREKRWSLNLDVLGRDMDGITGWPGADGMFGGPALFLAGEESDYVQQGHRDEIKRLFPKARIARIPGAGHWLHADAPGPFEAAVGAFLDA